VSAPVIASTTQEKPKDSDQFEWVTIEQSGELVYEAPETIAAEPPPVKSAVQATSPIPAHSLAAFGLFLRLPGYAEVLLKERKHAQCLLRLVLGVTDDGEGSKCFQLLLTFINTTQTGWIHLSRLFSLLNCLFYSKAIYMVCNFY
jgi:baculoviral IAP repeat-containing protein 6